MFGYTIVDTRSFASYVQVLVFAASSLKDVRRLFLSNAHSVTIAEVNVVIGEPTASATSFFVMRPTPS